MGKQSGLGAGDAGERPVRGMNRREMVRRLATAVTAGTAMAAAPAAVIAETAHRHPGHDPAPGRPDAPTSKTWKPLFFDPHQNSTFTIIAERIIPGSTDAKVSQFVDLLLSVDTLEPQKRFLNSLSAFDAYCLGKYQQPFVDLTAEQQNQVLAFASTQKPAEEISYLGRHHVLGPRNANSGEEMVLTMRDHFENLKHWASTAYFSSEPGMKSMGWTGQVYFTSFPNCKNENA